MTLPRDAKRKHRPWQPLRAPVGGIRTPTLRKRLHKMWMDEAIARRFANDFKGANHIAHWADVVIHKAEE